MIGELVRFPFFMRSAAFIIEHSHIIQINSCKCASANTGKINLDFFPIGIINILPEYAAVREIRTPCDIITESKCHICSVNIETDDVSFVI